MDYDYCADCGGTGHDDIGNTCLFCRGTGMVTLDEYEPNDDCDPDTDWSDE